MVHFDDNDPLQTLVCHVAVPPGGGKTYWNMFS